MWFSKIFFLAIEVIITIGCLLSLFFLPDKIFEIYKGEISSWLLMPKLLILFIPSILIIIEWIVLSCGVLKYSFSFVLRQIVYVLISIAIIIYLFSLLTVILTR